jgi:hypothetical protein
MEIGPFEYWPDGEPRPVPPPREPEEVSQSEGSWADLRVRVSRGSGSAARHMPPELATVVASRLTARDLGAGQWPPLETPDSSAASSRGTPIASGCSRARTGAPTCSYVGRVFRRAARAAGLRDFHFHDLRHHGATMALNAGFSAPIVMALGGWKTERMMRRYAAVTDGTLRRAAEAIGGSESFPNRAAAPART